jgi:branched-chain amino acid transport system ATP-binding protein
MNAPILSLRNLKKSFAETEIIRGVELDIIQGERHAIIGPNGAGKSTVFHLISGNLTPTSGEIVFNGRSIQGLAPQEINRHGLARMDRS